MTISQPQGTIDPVVGAALQELDERYAGAPERLQQFVAANDFEQKLDQLRTRLDRSDLGDLERAVLASTGLGSQVLDDTLRAADEPSLADVERLVTLVRQRTRDEYVPKVKTLVVDREVVDQGFSDRDRILAEALAGDLSLRPGRLREQLRTWASSVSATTQVSGNVPPTTGFDPCATAFVAVANGLHRSLSLTYQVDQNNIAAAGVIASLATVGPLVTAAADALVRGVLDDTIEVCDEAVCAMVHDYVLSRQSLLPVDRNFANQLLGPGLTGINLAVEAVLRTARELDAHDCGGGRPARARFEAFHAAAVAASEIASDRIGMGARMQIAQIAHRFDQGFSLLMMDAVQEAIVGCERRGDPTRVVARLAGQEVRAHFDVAYATLALFTAFSGGVSARVEDATDLCSAAVALSVARERAGLRISTVERPELQAVV